MQINENNYFSLIQKLIDLDILFGYDDCMPENIKLESIKIARSDIRKALTEEILKDYQKMRNDDFWAANNDYLQLELKYDN